MWKFIVIQLVFAGWVNYLHIEKQWEKVKLQFLLLLSDLAGFCWGKKKPVVSIHQGDSFINAWMSLWHSGETWGREFWLSPGAVVHVCVIEHLYSKNNSNSGILGFGFCHAFYCVQLQVDTTFLIIGHDSPACNARVKLGFFSICGPLWVRVN